MHRSYVLGGKPCRVAAAHVRTRDILRSSRDAQRASARKLRGFSVQRKILIRVPDKFRPRALYALQQVAAITGVPIQVRDSAPASEGAAV